jgi:hypothetical protein
MKKIFLVCAITAVVALSVYGQTKQQDIIRLLDITNAKMQAAQMFDLMLPNLKATAPDAPLTFWTMFRSKLDVNSLVDSLVPIYDRHFLHDDIKELIRFYESSVGKKLLDVTPRITQESYHIGEEFGEKLASDVLNELKMQGYLNY